MLWLADIYFTYAYLHMYKGDKRTSDIIRIAENLGMTMEEFKNFIQPFNPYYTHNSVTWEEVVGFREKDAKKIQELLDSLNIMATLTGGYK